VRGVQGKNGRRRGKRIPELTASICGPFFQNDYKGGRVRPGLIHLEGELFHHQNAP